MAIPNLKGIGRTKAEAIVESVERASFVRGNAGVSESPYRGAGGLELEEERQRLDVLPPYSFAYGARPSWADGS